MSHFWTVVGIIELVWAIILAGGLILERRSPVATLAWIMVLVWLPLLGFVIYFFLGPRRLRRKKMRRAATRSQVRASMDELDVETDDLSRIQLAQLAVSAGEAPPMRVERIELFTEGDECFASILKAIEGATHHIHVEYYIWQPDRIGGRMIEMLARKAKAGVEVRLLLDGVGAHPVPRRFLQPLLGAGGKVEWFNPLALLRLRVRRADFRSHRKIVVVDGHIGFTGGMNVDDCHAAEFSGPKAWRDTHLRFEGPAVRALQRVFLEDWAFASEEAPPSGTEYLPRPKKGGDQLVQVVGSGPDSDVFPIQKLYFAAIGSAKQRVWITTPYFVPDEPILEAIATAAMRKVDVRILVPREGDNPLVTYAARSYFPDLLGAGAKIYEYEGRFIHAKTMVVDDDFSIVGTANLDNRSFRLNFEVVAAVYGNDLTARLAAVYEDDLGHATQVFARALKRETLLVRIAEGGARLLSPLL